MINKNKTILCLFFLAGCSSRTAVDFNDPKHPLFLNGPSYYSDDINEKDRIQLDLLVASFTAQIDQHWGKDQRKVSSQNRLVKYFDDYLTRADLDFENGMILIETLHDDPAPHLHKAAQQVLLSSENPRDVNLFSDQDLAMVEKPFLYEQVLDHEGQPIQWEWRANRYITYLLNHQLKVRLTDDKKVFFFEIPMLTEKEYSAKTQYARIIKYAAQKYGVSEQLIYAIIKTESSFNPQAVSVSNAYGLMQIMPDTAGRDVFQKIKGIDGQPSKDFLFNPVNNIDIGAGYIYLLKNNYLKDVEHPKTLEYTLISAYNSGAGGVLDAIDPNSRQNAMARLNQLSPDEVYWILTNHHPKEEARNYLKKVIRYKKDFVQN